MGNGIAEVRGRERGRDMKRRRREWDRDIQGRKGKRPEETDLMNRFMKK